MFFINDMLKDIQEYGLEPTLEVYAFVYGPMIRFYNLHMTMAYLGGLFGYGLSKALSALGV